MPDSSMSRRTAIAAAAAGAAGTLASRGSALAQEPDGAVDFDVKGDAAFDLSTSNVQSIRDLDPKAKSLGSSVYLWHGDDLPRRVGGPPRGYVTKTYMTEWTRGKDDKGYMSFGPYFKPSAVGSLFKLRFIMSLSNRGAADDQVLTADCVDHANNGANLIRPVTFKVKNFPAGSEGFIIFSNRDISIKPGMNIETRVYARGGASLSLYQIRYDVHYL